MKRIIIIPLLLISLILSATNYHVKTGGSDAADGSIATPWATITKVNTVWAAGTFAPGDSIVFYGGNTFYGTIIVTESGTLANPIIIGKYGAGADPIITGFTILTSWTNEGGGVFSKVVTSDALTSVIIVDDVQVRMGRYPDYGTNLTYTTATASRITDPELGAVPDWDGAEVVINKKDYVLDRCLITAHATTTIDFTNLGGTTTANANRYYFIQNDIRCVTATNEWYHSTSEGKLYIYDDPAAKVVKMATLNYLIDNSGAYDYITVDNINFQGSISHVIYCASSSVNWTIQNCTITNGGQDGIHISGGSGAIINANTISYCNNSGISSACNTTNITNNIVSDIGLLAGLSYSGTYCDGIYIYGTTILVQYNNIQRTGSNGIHSGSSTAFTIKNNFINYPMQVIDDGGGIYFPSAFASVRTVEGNIILNSGVGGFDNNYTRGIYADASASNAVIKDNIVGNSMASGIMNGGGINNTITGNICFNNKNAGIFIQDYAPYGGTTPTGLVMTGNTFVAKATTQYAVRCGMTDAQIIASFTTSDNNYFARPADDDYVFWKDAVTKYITLSAWKTLTGKDVASLGSPIAVADTSDIDLYYNASQVNNVLFTLPYASIDLAGTKYATDVTLDAYQGIVLLKDPDSDPLPPDPPTVTTNLITYTGALIATGGGNVINTGGGTISARGVCWNTTGTPTTGDSKTTDGTGTGVFTSTLSGIVKNTTYYVRAYATNEVATSYGYEVSFIKGNYFFFGPKIVMYINKVLI